MAPFGVAFVQETTIFREFGPLSGSTMRLSYEVAPKIGSMLSRQTFDGDARKYFRLGATGLLALRARGFKSMGDNPDFTYFGGNWSCAATNTCSSSARTRSSPTPNCASR